MKNYSSNNRPERSTELGYTQSGAPAGQEGGWQILEPPPDVIAPMVAVEQGTTRAQTTTDGGWQILEPPPDVIAPMVAVEMRAARPHSQSVPESFGPTFPELDTEEMNALISLKDGAYSDDLLAAEDAPRLVYEPPTAELDHQAMYRIIRAVALSDSGADLYAAVGQDEEFNTPGHPAHGQRHFGLSFGMLRFTQASGRLGSVLRLMQTRDPDSFSLVFGPAAPELLAVTNAATPEERLQPVAGVDLWSASWVERFRLAGGIPSFQAAQNEEAIEGLFRPMLKVAFGLGFDTDRGLAMCLDRVVVMGLGAGLRWVAQSSGPLASEMQRQGALEILGYPTLTAFQQAAQLARTDGRFGAETHAALVDALRAEGKVPLPSRHELQNRLLDAAEGPARVRLLRLQSAEELADRVFLRTSSVA